MRSQLLSLTSIALAVTSASAEGGLRALVEVEPVPAAPAASAKSAKAMSVELVHAEAYASDAKASKAYSSELFIGFRTSRSRSLSHNSLSFSLSTWYQCLRQPSPPRVCANLLLPVSDSSTARTSPPPPLLF